MQYGARGRRAVDAGGARLAEDAHVERRCALRRARRAPRRRGTPARGAERGGDGLALARLPRARDAVHGERARMAAPVADGREHGGAPQARAVGVQRDPRSCTATARASRPVDSVSKASTAAPRNAAAPAAASSATASSATASSGGLFGGLFGGGLFGGGLFGGGDEVVDGGDDVIVVVVAPWRRARRRRSARFRGRPPVWSRYIRRHPPHDAHGARGGYCSRRRSCRARASHSYSSTTVPRRRSSPAGTRSARDCCSATSTCGARRGRAATRAPRRCAGFARRTGRCSAGWRRASSASTRRSCSSAWHGRRVRRAAAAARGARAGAHRGQAPSACRGWDRAPSRAATPPSASPRARTTTRHRRPDRARSTPSMPSRVGAYDVVPCDARDAWAHHDVRSYHAAFRD